MPVLFITGASSGIGKETAKYFANKGQQVISTMRNLAKAGDLVVMPNMTIMPLDVTNSSQVAETCQKALEQYDVDVLLNNAGYAIMAPLEIFKERNVRKMFDADVIGSLVVMQQFIPHFKKRRAGSIRVTTSLAALIAFPRDAVYGAAKRAQQGMVESLYYELKPYGVAGKAMLPGGTSTNFPIPVYDMEGYENFAANQRKFLLDGNPEFPGPQEAAQIIYGAATDGKDQINYPTDSVCRKLYDQYEEMGIEKFKDFFYNYLHDGK